MENNDNHPQKSRVELHLKDYNKKHHAFLWLLGIVAVAVAAAAIYSAYVYFKTKTAADNIYDNTNHVEMKKGEFNGKNKFAVLLMGTDTGALDRTEKVGNTDTMIIAVVNPAKKRYTLMSIPRDTMTLMVGNPDQEVQKVNAAYPIGGAKMSLASVSALVNVPLKYYAVVNMKGIMKLIRYFGGLNIRPTLSFEYGGYVFKKGQLTHMGGAGALAYSRMRYDDPEGDYGRQKRQRQVITTLIKKALSIDTLTKLNEVLPTVSHNLKTNLSFKALEQIVMNYRGSAKNVKNDYLHGINAMVDGAAYQVQATSELQRVCDYLRQELGLAKEKVNNYETYQNKRNIANGFDFKNPKNYRIFTDRANTNGENNNEGDGK